VHSQGERFAHTLFKYEDFSSRNEGLLFARRELGAGCDHHSAFVRTRAQGLTPQARAPGANDRVAGAARTRSGTVVGFRGISNSFRLSLSAARASCPDLENPMQSSDLKKLVVELDVWLDSRGGLLDAPARDELKARLDRCAAAIEVAIEEEEKARIRAELYQIFATLIGVFTNLMSLFNK
jgi:hypothetical protein